MQVWVFIAAGFALMLGLMLRAPQSLHPFKAGIFFLIGLGLGAGGIRAVTSVAGVDRVTDYDAFVAHAANLSREDDAPVALFVGASFSRNAIDDEQLTQDLRALGYPHRAINLSLEGASLQERHANLKAYIERSKRTPDVVFFGVAQEFDASSAYVFNVAKFSDRAIDQFTPSTAKWAAVGIASGACEGLVGCVKDTGLGAVHLGLNLMNVGLLSGGKNHKAFEAKPSFDPQIEPRQELADDDINKGLSQLVEIKPLSGPAWAMAFRAQQRNVLAQKGVRRIAYYSPPVISADQRAYAQSLCAGELSDFTCIDSTNPQLLESLNGQSWFDDKHLLANGAKAYTQWLANEIDARRVLK